MSLNPSLAKPLPPAAWPGLGKMVLAGLVALAVMFGGMALITPPDGAPTDEQLRLSLPAKVGDLEMETIVYSGPKLAGHVLDDPLHALGRSWEEASMAFADADNSDVSIFVVAVRGVTGERLESAIATHWLAMSPRDRETIGGKPVVVLTGPAPDRAYVYRRGMVVYVVETADEALAAEALAALP